MEASTDPEITIEEVRLPSILSLAVAPGSVKLLPTVMVIDDAPFNDIVGGVVSGGGFTRTVLEIEVVLFALSDTLYSIVYVPAVEVSTVPEIVIEEVISPSTSSDAVAPGSVNVYPT